MSTPSSSRAIKLRQAAFTGVNLNLGEKDSTFELIDEPLRELKQGEVLIKTLYLSNDPTQRAWIQKGIDPERMYTDPVSEGEIMKATGIAEIVKSNSSKYKVGETISCFLRWQDFCIIAEKDVFNVIPQSQIPLTAFLDTIGMTGLTAYFGLFDVAKLKATDTLVVSAASGATGSVVVQIAKNVIGCKRVIGISGGPEKCKYVESIGADACVDYKSATFGADLEKAIKGDGDQKYADVFFDGVGGSILDKMLTLVKPFGTIIACGTISGYNDFRKGFVRNWGQIITMRLQVKGFIIIDYVKEYPGAVQNLLKWMQEGKIRADKGSFTLVDLSKSKEDFKKIPETWGILFSDKKGPGKLLTKL